MKRFKKEETYMNILLSCAGGMSSSILADAIKDEAKKENIEINIDPIGTESVEERLGNTKYDLILLAPKFCIERILLTALLKKKEFKSCL